MPSGLGPRSLALPYRHVYRVNVPGLGRTPAVFDETTDRLWPDPKKGPYRLTLYWVRRNGRPEPVGMQLIVEGIQEAQYVTLMTSTLRDVRIAEIAAEDRESLAFVPPDPPTPNELVASMRPATVKRLRRAADIYQEAWRAGENPTQEVARRMNKTTAAAGNLVKRARDAGFLPATSAGKPQG
jgi:hypothetical protein